MVRRDNRSEPLQSQRLVCTLPYPMLLLRASAGVPAELDLRVRTCEDECAPVRTSAGGRMRWSGGRVGRVRWIGAGGRDMGSVQARPLACTASRVHAHPHHRRYTQVQVVRTTRVFTCAGALVSVDYISTRSHPNEIWLREWVVTQSMNSLRRLAVNAVCATGCSCEGTYS